MNLLEKQNKLLKGATDTAYTAVGSGHEIGMELAYSESQVKPPSESGIKGILNRNFDANTVAVGHIKGVIDDVVALKPGAVEFLTRYISTLI